MSSRNVFSQKPQRRIGRRSMALNSTNNNTTLNGTLNGTAKPISDFSYKLPYEPSCASTPLPDHTKNKENIYLSSIKPVLASSPKLTRQAPYQTQKVVKRLVRRSIALRTQREEASLNDSLTRMRDINASLKLSDPKQHSESFVPSSQPSTTNATGNGSSFQSSMNSFLNYEFLKKFLPASSAPAPLRSSPVKKSPRSSPLGLKPKYESLLKNCVVQCEMISEATSESPTMTDVMAEPPAQEEDEVTYRAFNFQDERDYGDFLKKSLNCTSHKMGGESSSPAQCMDSKYGSFLEEMSPPALAERETKDEMECEDTVQDSKPSSSSPVSLTKPVEQLEDAHNRTFELDEQPVSENLLFKTPQPPKFFKKDAANESIRTPMFKTPMSSVFSRFTNNDGGDDSFVENERTIMLQFRNEIMQLKKNETPPTTNETIGESNVVPTPFNNVGGISNASSNVNDSVANGAAHVIESIASETPASIATTMVPSDSSIDTNAFGNVATASTNTPNIETKHNKFSVSNNTTRMSSTNFELDSANANTSNVTNITKTGSNITLNATTSSIETLFGLIAKQQRDLAEFREQQRQAMNEFLARQNEQLNQFVFNVAHNYRIQNTAVPTITISEFENSNTTGQFENTAINGFDKTMKEKSVNTTDGETMINNSTLGVKPTGESGNETCVDTSIVNETQKTMVQSTGNESISLVQPKSNTKRTMKTRQSILSQTLQEEDQPISVKPRQSLAFNNFKRNCSILKTPARGNRKSYANTTVFTPGTLSTCIRDQLEALEQE